MYERKEPLMNTISEAPISAKPHKALAFIAGVGAGIAAGMLLAPRSGQETRNRLRGKAVQTRDALKQKMTEGEHKAMGRAAQAVGAAEQAISAVQAAAEEVKTKLSNTRVAAHGTGKRAKVDMT